MTSSFHFIRVRGIAIGAHWSWLVIAALIVWSLAGGLFPVAYPGLDPAVYIVMAVVAAVLFFGSVLLHELGHALTAVREGVEIHEITLWLLGGVAQLRGRPRSPGAEFRVSVAGPVVTIALAAAFFAIAQAAGALGWPSAVVGVADYLALINLLLLAFNLAPALPLDGGRVLRSWLWHRQRSYLRATRMAARAGRAFGLALIAIGVLTLFTGAGLSGLWFVLLGWFLSQAAQAEAEDALTRQSLRGLTVGDVMRRDPATVSPDLTVDGFLDTAASARFSTFPVVVDGELRGLVSLRQASAIPLDDRATRRVGEIMTPADQLTVVGPGEDVDDALTALQSPGRRAVVAAAGRVVGVLSAGDVAHALEVRQARGLPPEPRGRRGGALIVTVLVTLAVLIVAGLLYRPPLVVLTPGPTFDVARDVTIQGRSVTPIRGRYLATSVRLEQPTAFGAIIAGLRPDQEVLRREAVLPANVPERDYLEQQRRLFEESRQLAAAAAARAVGIPVDIRGSGVRVAAVLPSAPARRVLRPGDVIVAANGQRIDEIGALQRIVASRPAGSAFRLTIERSGGTRQVEVRSVSLPEVSQGVGIGISGQTRDLRVDLPFQITFAPRGDVGGPSAGVAYALVVADLLAARDYAGGRTVAATGTIRVDGAIGVVGGVAEKAAGAEDAGASIFLVPREEVGRAGDGDAGLTVRGVDTLDQALDILFEPS